VGDILWLEVKVAEVVDVQRADDAAERVEDKADLLDGKRVLVIVEVIAQRELGAFEDDPIRIATRIQAGRFVVFAT
jgi:hypothetical protein